MHPSPPAPPSPRPSPDEVRAWFAAPLLHAALDGYVAILEADPNWLVALHSCRATRRLRLFYFPRGEEVRIVLSDDGALWRPEPGALP